MSEDEHNAAMQQGSEDVGRQPPMRYYVHTSHDSQAMTSIGFDSLHLASEHVADVLIEELRNVVGYRVQGASVIMDVQQRTLPGALGMARAVVAARIELNGDMLDDDDVHGVIAARVALSVNSSVAPDLPWIIEYRKTRITVQRTN